MCIVFSSLDEGPCKTYRMSKVRVGLLRKTNSSLQTSVPCRAAKGSLGVFFGIYWKSNKMQRCWSQGTASDKQNCWAPPQASESQDPKAEGGVPSETECEGWKCALLLWLTDSSLSATSLRKLIGKWLASPQLLHPNTFTLWPTWGWS